MPRKSRADPRSCGIQGQWPNPIYPIPKGLTAIQEERWRNSAAFRKIMRPTLSERALASERVSKVNAYLTQLREVEAALAGLPNTINMFPEVQSAVETALTNVRESLEAELNPPSRKRGATSSS